MARLAKDGLEVLLFFLFTSLLYLLFIITVPMVREPHGLLAMSELADLSRSGLVLGLLFGSAGIFVFLGIFVMNWVSFFSPGVVGDLLAMTYFFFLVASIFFLSI